MAYSYINFGQAKSTLAQRLSDPTKQFWADSELGEYFSEALQSFNALANFYRQEFLFNSRANVTWYDLTDSASLPNTLRPLSEMDLTLINMIQLHLLEPVNTTYPLVWAGSLQFNFTDILNAIQQTRDELLSESRCTISQGLVSALPGRTFLSESVLGLRRVTWIPATGQGYSPNTLLPSDLWAQQSFEAAFPQASPGIPKTYRLSTEPPLGFDVDIQPNVPGNWDLLTVDAGGDLTTAAPTILPIPNDWCWVAKWGALRQLLGRDSVAADPFRAKYCQMRYDEGLAAMKSAPALLAARINDQPVVVTAVTEADFYDANWQAQAPGAPTRIYYAGLNMVALSTQPSSAGYSITASVVRNMVLPSMDSDDIQIGRDDLNAVLDEAQHLAMFKCGGAEFASSFPLHSNFLKRCAVYNAKLAALSAYLEFLDGAAQADERLHPSFQSSGAQ